MAMSHSLWLITQVIKYRLIPVKDYDELEAWIYRISGKHDFNTEVFKIGETEEGRNIVGLHIGDKNHSSDKPKVRTT